MTTNVAYPKVLVLLSGLETEEKKVSLQDEIHQQTYKNIEIIAADGKEEAEGIENKLKKSSADYFLHWSFGFKAESTAIEKLVWALHSSESYDLIKDEGIDPGVPVLIRNRQEFWSLAEKGVTSDVEALEWSRDQRLTGVSIGEKLFWYTGLNENLEEGEKAECSEKINLLFPKIVFEFEQYEPISCEVPFELKRKVANDKNILLLVSSLPMGGACKFNLDAVEELKKQGYHITICTTANYSNPWLGEFLKITSDVFILHHYLRFADFPRFILHLIRSREIGTVLLSHSMLAYHLLPYLRGRAPDVAFADYTHIEYETEWPHGGYAQVSVGNQSLLDLQMVSSHHLKKWMVDKGAKESQIRVCYTNIDDKKWQPSVEDKKQVRKELGISEKTTMILYACRIAEQKRPELMCEVLRNLAPATKAPFVFVIAGDGPLMPQVEKFIEEKNLKSWVQFLGTVELSRMAQLHNAADLFFLPSQIEGISLALFEAMALESVPVISKVGGQDEVVTSDCGFLIPHSDKEYLDYVQVLKMLIENSHKRVEMAKKARKRVQDKFPLHKMADQLGRFLEETSSRKDRRENEEVCDDAEKAHATALATLGIDFVRLQCQGQDLVKQNQDLHHFLKQKEAMIERLQTKLRKTLERKAA